MSTRKPSALSLASLLVLTAAGFAQTAKLSTATLAFSAQLIGTTGAAKNLTLTNTDNATPLAIDEILDSADYSETDTCGTSLAPLASCTISVTFTPSGPGVIAGAITIQDEASNSPQIVSLTGSGVTPVSFSPATLPFGTVALGSKSSKQLTITNNQNVSATLLLTTSGDYSMSPGLLNPCGANLAAKTSCTVTVTFQPNASGTINGALTIKYNAQFSPADVPLTGSGGSGGKTPPLAFTPSSVAFGNVVVNTTSAGKVVTVKNVSATGVTINTFPASGNYVAKGSGATPCGGLLNAGASCTITVTFRPTVAGAAAGVVTVNDTGTVATQVLSVTGTGIQLVTLTPATLTFGAQNLGTTSAAQIVTLTNHQTADTLSIDNISITGDFSTVTAGKLPCGTRLAALASCTIGVVFSPGAGSGAVKGALTVAYNATPSPALVGLNATAKGTLMRFAFTANDDNTISSYTVDPVTGQLRSASYVLSASRPNAIVATPSNAFVYTANFSTGNVSGYAVGRSGSLTPVPGFPFAAEPFSFAITTDPSGKFLYIANANSTSNNISGYTINSATGTLTQMTGSPFQADFDTRAIVVDRSGKFLYAANASSDDVSAYTINSTTGVLTPVPGSPFALPAGGSVPQSIAVDPATKFVFVGDTASTDVCAFAINPANGALTVVAGSPFANSGFDAVSLVVDPTGRFLYTGDDAASVTGFSINGATGALSVLSGSPFALVAGAASSSVSTDPLGRFLYATDSTAGDIFTLRIDSGSGNLTLSRTAQGRPALSLALANGTAPITYTPKFTYIANSDSNDISAYATDPESGGLTQITGSPFKVNGPLASDPQAVSLAVDAAGKFAYAAEFNGNGNNGSVGAFTVNPLTGALTLTSGSPFTVGDQARTVVIDPSGRFVYITTPFSDSIYGFSINRATGNLVALSGSPFLTGAATSPWGAAIDPSGRYLCITKQATNQVAIFSINTANGNLTAVTTVPTGSSAISVAVDPSGRFLYVAATFIYGYTLTPTGMLTVISGAPFTAGADPQSVAVDPTGRFLYTANHDSNDVSAFAIDQTTGFLTNIPGAPFAAGQNADGVSVDLSGSFVYVANAGDNDVSAFTLDPVSGALTPNFLSPFVADSVPSGVAMIGTAH